MRPEHADYEVDKVDIGIISIANILLYININMSTLYKYIYFNRWTLGGHSSRQRYLVHFLYFLCPLFYEADLYTGGLV